MQQNLILVWSWLFKGVVVVLMNMYFILDWLIKRGRFYHAYWSDEEYDLESLYINVGVTLTMFQLFIVIVFCCVSGSFTMKVSLKGILTILHSSVELLGIISLKKHAAINIFQPSVICIHMKCKYNI